MDCCLTVCKRFSTNYHIPLVDVGSWQSCWGVMTASHCYRCWRWWSDTVWVTLRRIWHLFLSSCFWFHWNWLNSYHQSVIVEFLCNLIGICNKIEISVRLWRLPGHFAWYNHWTTLIFEAFNSALLFEVWILWDGTKWDQLCLQTMQKLYGKENEMIFRNNWLHLQFFLMFHCEFLMSLMLW